MLQQTRVETVIPYYRKWMETFPDLESLAKAGDEQVMRLWEGLGYYGRARNMLKAARLLANDHHGEFPRTVEELRKLPGVGEYMAGALASIAMGTDEIALDGNGLRVIARLIASELPIDKPEGKAALGVVMRQMLPQGTAGDFNQAIMDLGSQICTPREPACGQCPLKEMCTAFQRDTQIHYPVKERKAPIPHYLVVAAVIRREMRC
jgi:A/G-specific adenine glycosylase